jgi:kinesin family protein 11
LSIVQGPFTVAPCQTLRVTIRIFCIAGIANRHRAETQLNLQSSRSHCIFTVTLCAGGAGGGPAVAQRLSSLSFVDLAGSGGIFWVEGEREKEREVGRLGRGRA